MADWMCENIFCGHVEICSNQTNCLDCEDRIYFLNYVFSDKKPSETKWGSLIIEALNDN